MIVYFRSFSTNRATLIATIAFDSGHELLKGVLFGVSEKFTACEFKKIDAKPKTSLT